MKKLAVILTSAVLAFSAVGCQAWGTSSKCCCCNKKCSMCNKCNKRCHMKCRCNNKMRR